MRTAGSPSLSQFTANHSAILAARGGRKSWHCGASQPYPLQPPEAMMTDLNESDLFQSANPGVAPVEWVVSGAPVPYRAAVAEMEERVQAIAEGKAAERVWLLEHPPLYTAGTSAKPGDLRDARFPVHYTGRGGQFTYHGPGQRVAYVMLDLKRRKPDLRLFVASLEAWVIATLAGFGIRGERREGRVGVWVARPGRPRGPSGEPAEDKIAAIGIRIRHWTSFHGIALNVCPDLRHFAGIVPCGVKEAHLGVTSFVDLGVRATMAEVDEVLRREFTRLFGPTTAVADDSSDRQPLDLQQE